MSEEKVSKAVLVEENKKMAQDLIKLGCAPPELLTAEVRHRHLQAQNKYLAKLLNEATKSSNDNGNEEVETGTNNSLFDDILHDVADELVNGKKDESVETKNPRLNDEIVYVPGMLYHLLKKFSDEALSDLCEAEGVSFSDIPKNQADARLLDEADHDKLARQLQILEQVCMAELGFPFLREARDLANKIRIAADKNQLEELSSCFEVEDQVFVKGLASCKYYDAVREIFYKFPRVKLLKAKKATKEEEKKRTERQDSPEPSHPATTTPNLDDYERRTNADIRVKNAVQKIREQLEQTQEELERSQKDLNETKEQVEAIKGILDNETKTLECTLSDIKKLNKKLVKQGIWKHVCWLLLVIVVLLVSGVILEKSPVTAPPAKTNVRQQKVDEKPVQNTNEKDPITQEQSAYDKSDQQQADTDPSLKELNSLLQKIEGEAPSSTKE